MLVDGLAQGRNPTQTALDIVGRVSRATGRRTGGLIGLSGKQIEYVLSARLELASGDPKLLRKYLERGLRDKRFDPTVRRAIKAGKPVTQADISNLTARYSDRLLKHRAEAIALTETGQAVHAGKHEGMRQLIDTGAIQEEQIKRTWDASGDSKVRDSHNAMDGQKVSGLSTPFTSPETGAQLMHPLDSSLGAPASEIIRCRCFENIRIDHVGGLKNGH